MIEKASNQLFLAPLGTMLSLCCFLCCTPFLDTFYSSAQTLVDSRLTASPIGVSLPEDCVTSVEPATSTVTADARFSPKGNLEKILVFR